MKWRSEAPGLVDAGGGLRGAREVVAGGIAARRGHGSGIEAF